MKKNDVFFANPETKDVMRVAVGEKQGTNPRSAAKHTDRLVIFNGVEGLAGDRPGVASMEDLCAQYGVSDMDAFTHEELLKAISRKLRGKMLILLITKREDGSLTTDFDGELVGYITQQLDKCGETRLTSWERKKAKERLAQKVQDFSDWYAGQVLLITSYDLEGTETGTAIVYLGGRSIEDAIHQDLDENWRAIGKFPSIRGCLKAKKEVLIIENLEWDYNQGMRVLDIADELKNAYFWKGDNGDKYGRASYDRAHSASATWVEGGVTWSASVTTTSTRRHVYPTKEYYRGDEKTNLKAVRNSLERLKEEIDEMKKKALPAEDA